MNQLYFGDNLHILRDHIATESVDLIYLDPPFNSKADYNILFKERSGNESQSQITAFEDTWTWSSEAAAAFHEIFTVCSTSVNDLMTAFKSFLGNNDMMAYLTMMCIRLHELRRVLKPTGTIYLHCDPTASHYVKLLMDAVFGHKYFQNEIVWRRTNAKGLAFTRFASDHDIILRYTKSATWKWHAQYKPHNPDYVEKFYRFVEPQTGRKYTLDNLINPNKNRPNLTYEFLGVTRVWRWTRERMQKAFEHGLVVQTNPGSVPRLKRYLDEQEGTPIDDIWDDIMPIQAQSSERLGYPTQKPEALLERIIQASSDPGDIVLDPFCGCGTAVSAAQKTNRGWIGIDITHLAINLIKKRLLDMFGKQPDVDYEVHGEPKDLEGAKNLANTDRYQFQWWALSLINAKPYQDKKKGTDRGIDGIYYFDDSQEQNQVKRAVVQVKSGKVQVKDIRDLAHVLEREKVDFGIFITLEDPTKPMLTEAADVGLYSSSTWQKSYPRLQILTIADLLQNDAKPDIPSSRPIAVHIEAKKQEDQRQKDLFAP